MSIYIDIEMEKEIHIVTYIESVMDMETDIDIDVDADHYIDVANVATAQPRPSAAV